MGSRMKGRRERKKDRQRPFPVLKITVYALLAVAVMGLMYWYWFSPEGQEKTRQALHPNAPPLQTTPS